MSMIDDPKCDQKCKIILSSIDDANPSCSEETDKQERKHICSYQDVYPSPFWENPLFPYGYHYAYPHHSYQEFFIKTKTRDS
jgi:hypothetical protein